MYKTRAERILALALERKETKAWGNYKAVNPESSKPVQPSCSSNDNNNDTVFSNSEEDYDHYDVQVPDNSYNSDDEDKEVVPESPRSSDEDENDASTPEDRETEALEVYEYVNKGVVVGTVEITSNSKHGIFK